MDASDSYLVLERIISAGEILLSELEHLLTSLEEQKLIPAEHTALRELARKISGEIHRPLRKIFFAKWLLLKWSRLKPPVGTD